LQSSIHYGALANHRAWPQLSEDLSPHGYREAAVEEHKHGLARFSFAHQDPTRLDLVDRGTLTAAQDSIGQLFLHRRLTLVGFLFHIPTLLQ
jgi:hypothetical protein